MPARESYEESLAVRRQSGDEWGMSWALFRLGVLATWEGRFAEATAMLDESLQRSTAIRFGQGSLLALLGLGEALHAGGHHGDAGSRFADALTTARELEEDTGAGVALAGLASVAVAVGDLDAAARWLDEPEADPADDAQRAVATRAALFRGRAALALARGDDQAAEALHLEALRRRQLLGDNRAIVEELEALAIIAVRQGDNTPRRDTPRGDRHGGGPRWGSPSHPATSRRAAPRRRARRRRRRALDEAWQTGRDLSVDEAVSLALAVEPGSG